MQNNIGKILEVCIDADELTSLPTNICHAFQAGAQRIELCSAMKLQGLTPSREAIRLACQFTPADRELLVMIRPENSLFTVNTNTLKSMLAQIHTAASLGATGVVFGAIKDQQLDIRVSEKLIATAKELGLSITFHRAFDCISNPVDALEMLINWQVDRVLTNGTAWNSKQPPELGFDKITALLQQANNQLEIVIGGGVSLHNAAAIWQLIERAPSLCSMHVHSCVHNAQGIVDKALIHSLLSGKD